ncbi:MAG TPA: hypothetical protein VKU89_08380 [Solirubrobacteraceae bacterium]|nr:hypothetical protein [Solirubrobacteraceae bacterium]
MVGQRAGGAGAQSSVDAAQSAAGLRALRPRSGRCASCGAPLAPDQRYCIACGERAAPSLLAELLARAAARSRPPQEPRRALRERLSPDLTTIGLVATLLLCLGVGVLIGESAEGGARRTASPTVELLGGGAATQSTTAQSSEALTPASAAGSTAKSKSPSTAKEGEAPAPAKPTKQASAPPNPTVTVGQKGSGPGYHKGRFTGGFFGSEAEEEGTGEEEGLPGEEGAAGAHSHAKGPSTGAKGAKG